MEYLNFLFIDESKWSTCKGGLKLKVTENWRDDGHPGQVHHCCDIAGSLNRGTFRGLITAIPVVGLILWDPFAAALQMVQELKPRFVNLRRQQRELLMKSNDYKNDCTNNILIYRLDSLAGSMKSSTDPTSDLGRLYVYRVIGLVLLAVVFVFVTFLRCIFLSA